MQNAGRGIWLSFRDCPAKGWTGDHPNSVSGAQYYHYSEDNEHQLH
jgi:hypothetical protein